MTKSKRPSYYVAAFLAAFALALFASAPSQAEIHCAGGQCHCSGDKDCNTMFTSLCKDKGGSCNNDNNTCTCPQALKSPTTGTGGKRIPKTTGVLQNNKAVKQP
jgi:hypothetical protein